MLVTPSRLPLRTKKWESSKSWRDAMTMPSAVQDPIVVKNEAESGYLPGFRDAYLDGNDR